MVLKERKKKRSTAQYGVLRVRTCTWHLHKKDAESLQGQCFECPDIYQLP